MFILITSAFEFFLYVFRHVHWIKQVLKVRRFNSSLSASRSICYENILVVVKTMDGGAGGAKETIPSALAFIL